MIDLDPILRAKLTRRNLGRIALAESLLLLAAACEAKPVTHPSNQANGSRESVKSGGSLAEGNFWREDGMARFDFKFPNPKDKSTGTFTLSLKGSALKFDPAFREGTILPDIFMRVVFDASVKPFKIAQELGQLDLSKGPILSSRQEITLPSDLDPTTPHTLFTSWNRWQFEQFFWDGKSIPAKDALPTQKALILDTQTLIGRPADRFEVGLAV